MTETDDQETHDEQSDAWIIFQELKILIVVALAILLIVLLVRYCVTNRLSA